MKLKQEFNTPDGAAQCIKDVKTIVACAVSYQLISDDGHLTQEQRAASVENLRATLGNLKIAVPTEVSARLDEFVVTGGPALH